MNLDGEWTPGPASVDDDLKIDDELKLDDNLKIDEEPKLDDNLKIDEEPKLDDELKLEDVPAETSAPADEVFDLDAPVEELKLDEAPAEESSSVTLDETPAEEAPAAEEPAPAEEAPSDGLSATVTGFGGGDVTITLALDGEGKICALSVDASSQTAGLGQRASEEEFTAQFIGKTLPVAAEDIDALAGATITTNAVLEAVNSLAQ
jgi:hypothetical protein